MRRFWAAAIIVLFVACGDDGASSSTGAAGSSGVTSSSATTASGTGGTGAGGGASTGSGGGGAGGSRGSPIPVCLAACEVPSDCDGGTAPFDTDNYGCEGGACVYLGCGSSSECEDLGDYVCAGDPLAVCLPGCTVPADCDQGSGAAYDADNYTCDAGACVYTGCNDDGECATVPGGDYVCRSTGAIDSCLLACSTPADCDQGLPHVDADNYTCIDGACRYQGCNAGECAELGTFVCR